MALWRIPRAISETGRSRSALYSDIGLGLMVSPIKIGPRASALPEAEVKAVIAARIAGKSEAEIRGLVTRLQAARQQGVPA